MEKSGLPSGHKKQLSISTVITMILLIISFLWVFYDLYAYFEIMARSPSVESLSTFIGIGFILRILLFISFAIMLLWAFRNGVKSDLLVIASIIVGVVTAICLVFDFAALNDIGSDYLEYGYDCTLEWIWLFGSLMIRLLFLVTAFVLSIRILKGSRLRTSAGEHAVDEILFEVTQYVGIVCGFTGLVFTVWAYIALNDFTLKNWLVWLLMFYCLAIALPYLTMIIYWLVRLRHRTQLTVYDEKQKHDIAFSGLTAWLVSIPVMASLFIINFGKAASATVFLWLPFYLFITLLVFSLSLLLRFKKT
jgi:hypothetical protein